MILEWFKKRYFRTQKHQKLADLDFDASEISFYMAVFSFPFFFPVLCLIYEAPNLALESFQSEPKFYMGIFWGMLLMNMMAETTSYLDDTKQGKIVKSVVFYMISIVIFTYPLIMFEQYINAKDLSICGVLSFVIAYFIAPRVSKETLLKKLSDIRSNLDVDRLMADVRNLLTTLLLAVACYFSIQIAK